MIRIENYKIALIPESCISAITLLENKIKHDTGIEVALVAYEVDKKK